MTIQCCKCDRVLTLSRWVHVDPAPEDVSYSYCPVCLAEARHEFREEQRQLADVPGVAAVPVLATGG